MGVDLSLQTKASHDITQQGVTDIYACLFTMPRPLWVLDVIQPFVAVAAAGLSLTPTQLNIVSAALQDSCCDQNPSDSPPIKTLCTWHGLCTSCTDTLNGVLGLTTGLEKSFRMPAPELNMAAGIGSTETSSPCNSCLSFEFVLALTALYGLDEAMDLLLDGGGHAALTGLTSRGDKNAMLLAERPITPQNLIHLRRLSSLSGDWATFESVRRRLRAVSAGPASHSTLQDVVLSIAGGNAHIARETMHDAGVLLDERMLSSQDGPSRHSPAASNASNAATGDAPPLQAGGGWAWLRRVCCCCTPADNHPPRSPHVVEDGCLVPLLSSGFALGATCSVQMTRLVLAIAGRYKVQCTAAHIRAVLCDPHVCSDVISYLTRDPGFQERVSHGAPHNDLLFWQGLLGPICANGSVHALEGVCSLFVVEHPLHCSDAFRHELLQCVQAACTAGRAGIVQCAIAHASDVAMQSQLSAGELLPQCWFDPTLSVATALLHQLGEGPLTATERQWHHSFLFAIVAKCARGMRMLLPVMDAACNAPPLCSLCRHVAREARSKGHWSEAEMRVLDEVARFAHWTWHGFVLHMLLAGSGSVDDVLRFLKQPKGGKGGAIRGHWSHAGAWALTVLHRDCGRGRTLLWYLQLAASDARRNTGQLEGGAA